MALSLFFNDKLYYINVIKGIVEPVFQHKF